MQPVEVPSLGVAVRGGVLVDVFGKVLGDVPDGAVGVCRAGGEAAGIDAAEPRHVRRPFRLVERLVPGGQRLSRGRVDVGGLVAVPNGWPVDGIDGLVEGRPPDLVVGGRGDLFEQPPGQGASDGEVAVRGQAALQFDAAGVLGVPAGSAPKVLPPPVKQAGEVDGVQGGPPIVVGVRVDRRAEELVALSMQGAAVAGFETAAPIAGPRCGPGHAMAG